MAHEILVKQGETRTLEIIIKSPTGAPVNLTSAFFWLGVKRSPHDADYLILRDSQYFDYTNAAAGKVTVTLNSNDTIALDQGTFWMELKVSFGNGRIQKTVADYFLKVKGSIIEPKIVSVAGAVEASGDISGETT